MIEYLLASAAVGAVVYFYYRNDRLRRQQEASEEPEPEVYRPENGFDYAAAKERTDRQRMLLRQYEQINQLLDDVIVAMKSGEDLHIQNLSYYDHCGELHSLSNIEMHPERLQDFARKALDDCAIKCATSLSENCE